MSRRILSFLFCLLLACQGLILASAVPTPRAPDDLSAKLSKRVTNYNLGSGNFLEGLISASRDFQVPMGISWVNAPIPKAQSPLEWKSATVQEIIEAIVKTAPGYELNAKNGIVHVSAPALVPEGQNFLKSKIERFEIHGAYIELASFKLHQVVAPQTYAGISLGSPDDSRVTVELKNSTVEDALDALVITSDRKIWLVSFSEDTRLTSRGFHRTKSLFTDAAVSDKDEPVWHLQRWGDPLPPAIANPKQ